MTPDGTQSHDPSPEQPRLGRGRLWLRTLLWGLTVLAVAAASLVYVALDRNLVAPDWVKERISARIETSLPGMDLTFGSVEFVINKGWRPRIRLQDVVLLREDGTVLSQLAHAETTLAMRPLLRGQVQPKTIELFGAYGQLQRDSDGGFALSTGTGGVPLEQAASIPQMIEEWDRLFLLPQLEALVSIQVEALTLRYEDLSKGRGWTLDGGSIRFDRTGDDLRIGAGFSLLSGRDYASSVEASYASRIGDTEAEMSVSLQEIASEDIALQSVALEWLNVLKAPISGAIRGRIDSEGALGPVFASLQIGEGVLQPDDRTRPVPFNGARSYFTFDPDRQVLQFDELSVESGWGQGTAEGRAYLHTDERGQLSDLVGQFRFRGIEANPRGVFVEPLKLEGVTTDFRLELYPFRLTLGEGLVRYKDTNLRLSAKLSSTDQDWVYGLDARLDSIATDDVIGVWPEGLAAKPREWVAKNLSGGTMHDAYFALRSRPDAKPVASAGFAFTDTTIRFIKTQPPIRNAAGQASLLDNRFVVTAARGTVTPEQGGPLDVTGTSFIIPDTTIKKAAPAVVRVQGSGSVTTILSMLNRPPLRVLKNTTLPVDMVQGDATVAGTLFFPTKKKVTFEDVEFHLTGNVADVSSTALVPGHELTASAMSITGNHSEIRIFGDGALSGIPASAEWVRPIGKGVSPESTIKGRVELSQEAVDTFRIGLPAGTVTGTGIGAFELRLAPEVPPFLTLTSDLQGAGLRIPQLGWAKSRDSAGTFELSGQLGDQARIEKLFLDAAGLRATGSVINRAGGGLDRAVLSSISLGGWLDAAVELVGRGQGAAPGIRLLSGQLDLRKAPFGGGSDRGGASGNASGPMQVALDRLQITDSLALTGFRGEFSTLGGFNGTFRGNVNGGTAVTGTMVPQDQGGAIRIQSEDAGGVARDAAIVRNARGGSFDMTLVASGAPGQYEGRLQVRNTRVTDGPALAALLNSISLVGLIDEMSGNGIQFSAVNARFALGPNQVTIYESSAEGPSIGISMDGTYDVARSYLNMRGVISPIYLLNAVGSLVTRRGEGVFGFNYSLTGPADNPSVQVNPLSGLAPGMLRDIFRQPRTAAPPAALPAELPPEKPATRAPAAEDR
ncbi:MAG: DUF3971 domain-containing protein [Rhodobacteraceae bacterium]|nr:DUF3971 domain-containing protein [Paracoccaceae bacterium]